MAKQAETLDAVLLVIIIIIITMNILVDPVNLSVVIRLVLLKKPYMK